MPPPISLPYCLPTAAARSARASRRLNLASSMTPIVCVRVSGRPPVSLGFHGLSWAGPALEPRPTSIGIARELAAPLHKRVALVLARRDGEEAHGAQDRRVRQLGRGRYDRVGDVVVDGLFLVSPSVSPRLWEACPTECSSCLTSRTVPSLNVHLTTSVSGDAPLTHSLLSSMLQNLPKSWSLIKCQTFESGASITADSTTLAAVGIWEAILGV